jgi:uncharacterized protein (TIGR03066 family)
MKALQLVLLGCMALAIAGCGGSNKDKIIGTWTGKIVDGPKKNGEMTIEFSKDGKCKSTVKEGDQELPPKEGTYIVDGDKLTTIHMQENHEVKQTVTIQTLTDKDLVVKDEQGRVVEMKKK